MERLRELHRRGIDRRGFLAAASRTGLSIAAASALWSELARAAGPKRGGRLRHGSAHGSTTDSLDPATSENHFTLVLGFARFNYLTEIAPDGSLVGELAEDWDVSGDARVWSFRLRRGVEFHNGKPLTVEDVIGSIDHHRGADSKSAAKPIVDPIVDIRADGPERVVFELESGNADFPYILSDYHLAIMPVVDGRPDWRSGIGTGGYVLETFEPGVRAFLTRNPNYWKEGRAHFDEVELLSIIDTVARTSALTSGALDSMERVDLKTAHLLARTPGIRVEETSGTQHYTFTMRTDTPPFDDNEVRLALKYAIDRQAILDAVLRGHGYLGNDHPIGRSNRFHAAELPQREYDPEKAKFHLKKAGAEGLKVQLSAADAAFPGAVDAAVLYREHAAAAGIDIEVVREPNDGYWSNVWMKKPWCAVYWGGRPTEDWMFSTAYAAGAPWNDSFWNHERFNRLLIAARSELDEKKRREMYVEMQRIVRDEGGVVVPMFANYVFAMHERVRHGPQMAANWDTDGGRHVERWWFDES